MNNSRFVWCAWLAKQVVKSVHSHSAMTVISFQHLIVCYFWPRRCSARQLRVWIRYRIIWCCVSPFEFWNDQGKKTEPLFLNLLSIFEVCNFYFPAPTISSCGKILTTVVEVAHALRRLCCSFQGGSLINVVFNSTVIASVKETIAVTCCNSINAASVSSAVTIISVDLQPNIAVNTNFTPPASGQVVECRNYKSIIFTCVDTQPGLYLVTRTGCL